jgi:hypothetical protein
MIGAGKRVAAVRARELPQKPGPISPVATTGTPESITEVKTGIAWETDPSRKKQRTRMLLAGGAAALLAGGLVVIVRSLLASSAGVSPAVATAVEAPFDAGLIAIEPLSISTFVAPSAAAPPTGRRPVTRPAATARPVRQGTVAPRPTTTPSGVGFDPHDWESKKW